MTQDRDYTISVEISYTARGERTSAQLAEEIRRCERSIKAFLKERGCKNFSVVIHEDRKSVV